MISRRNCLVAVAVAVASSAVVMTPAPMPLRVAFGVPLLLVPGYALASALFGRCGLRGADLLLFSITLSLAVVIVGTFVLNWLPYGLTTTTWTALLAGTTLVAGLWAVLVIPAGKRGRSRTTLRPRPREIGVLAIALLIAVNAIAFGRTPLPAAGIQGYTSLWILPGGRHAGEVGVESSELHRTVYRLEIRDDQGHRIQRSLTLAPGQRWSARFRVPQSAHRVDARLFRRGSPRHVYRRVRLLLSSRTSTP